MLIYSNLRPDNINDMVGKINYNDIVYFCSNSPKKYMSMGDDKVLAKTKASFSNWYLSPFNVDGIKF